MPILIAHLGTMDKSFSKKRALAMRVCSDNTTTDVLPVNADPGSQNPMCPLCPIPRILLMERREGGEEGRGINQRIEKRKRKRERKKKRERGEEREKEKEKKKGERT